MDAKYGIFIPMKIVCASLLLVLLACSNETTQPASSTTTQAPTTTTQAATQPATTETSTSAPAGDPVNGTWPGQLVIDAHAGMATLNYVGPESGDFVPMRFRIESEVGKKILAECADQDLCEVKGNVQFLDETPPENASAVGTIVSVESVRKMPPDAR